jgi:hypothetical protein
MHSIKTYYNDPLLTNLTVALAGCLEMFKLRREIPPPLKRIFGGRSYLILLFCITSLTKRKFTEIGDKCRCNHRHRLDEYSSLRMDGCMDGWMDGWVDP